MKKFTLVACLICCIGAISCNNAPKGTAEAAPDEARKPNIIIIYMDDLGVKDLGFTGSTYYETPHIERLASKSMVFTQGYAGSRVCSPSRATILTGKFSARHGITDWIGACIGITHITETRAATPLP